MAKRGMAIPSSAALVTLLKGVESTAQGFGFGTGYGAGVRFGYTDVYPALREGIARIPYFGTGFDSAMQSKAPKPQPLKLPFGLG